MRNLMMITAAFLLLFSGTTLVYAQKVDTELDTLHQEATDLYRQGKYDRGRGRLRSWIIGIAKHLIADLRSERVKGSDGGLDDLLADEARLTRIWCTERRAALFAVAMDELRTQTRTSPQSIRAFEMVSLEQRAPDDVAEDLAMTRHDVYVAKHRVTERLREIVTRLESLCDDE